MIKFFRKIRQNLLSEGNTGKYLKYAIGEIVLVVIGILIAVQINSWNTALKKDDLKTTYTRNLIIDLTKDTIQLNARVRLNEEISLILIDSIKAIISNPSTTVNEIKTLGKNVGLSGLRVLNTYNNNTFNILTSSGNIDLFEENEIQKIMELNRLQNVQMSVSDANRETYFNIYTNYLQRYASSSSERSENITNEIWDNIDPKEHASIYINGIDVQLHTVSRYIELTKNVLTKTEELIEILKSSTEVE